MNYNEIIEQLPYSAPFLFVDAITSVSAESIQGEFTYHKDLDFYKGHFKHKPVTPGVILIETMAQIGLACFGIYLLKDMDGNAEKIVNFGLTTAMVDFLHPVFPGEKVTVKANKRYFRFGKLKCGVQMWNENNRVVCEGDISGMIITGRHE